MDEDKGEVFRRFGKVIVLLAVAFLILRACGPGAEERALVERRDAAYEFASEDLGDQDGYTFDWWSTGPNCGKQWTLNQRYFTRDKPNIDELPKFHPVEKAELVASQLEKTVVELQRYEQQSFDGDEIVARMIFWRDELTSNHMTFIGSTGINAKFSINERCDPDVLGDPGGGLEAVDVFSG